MSCPGPPPIHISGYATALLGEITALSAERSPHSPGGSLRRSRPSASNFGPLGLRSAPPTGPRQIPGYATVFRHFRCRGQECLNPKFFLVIYAELTKIWGLSSFLYTPLKNLICFFLVKRTLLDNCCKYVLSSFFCIFNMPMYGPPLY